jgi:hypothetical protein
MWLILAFVSLAMAHNPFEAVQSAERLNQTIHQTTGPQPACAGCDEYGAPKDLPDWKACLIEICQTNLNSELTQFQTAAAAAYAGYIMGTPEKRSLVKAFRDTVEVEKAFDDDVLGALKANHVIKYSRAANLWKDWRQLSKLQELEYKYEGSAVVVDREKSREKHRDMPAEEFENIVKMAGAWITSANDLPPLFQGDVGDMQMLLSPQKMRTLIDHAVKTFKEKEAATAQQLKIPLEKLTGDPARRRRMLESLNQVPLTPHALSSFKEEFTHTQTLHTIAMSTHDTLSENIPLSSIYSAEIRQRIEKRNAEMAAYLKGDKEKGKEIFEAEEKSVSTCMFYSALARMRLPTKAARDAFLQKDEPSMRERFANRISQMISTETGSLVKEHFGKLKVRGANTIEDFEADFKRNVKNISDKPFRMRSLRPEGQDTFLAISSLSADEPWEAGEKVNDLCKTLMVSRHDAHAFLESAQIYLGQSTVLDHRFSDYIAGHEYAHSFSGLMLKHGKPSTHSASWFKGIRDCLEEGQEEGARHVEENWADQMSMAFANSGKTYACDQLTGENESEFTLKKPVAGGYDGHAGPFFRLMQTYSMAGKIPDVCNKAMAAKGEKFTMPNCVSPVKEASSRPGKQKRPSTSSP